MITLEEKCPPRVEKPKTNMSCDSTCSTQSELLQGGAKKKRPMTAWMQLVMRIKKENPDKKLMEVLKMAKKEYKPTATSKAPVASKKKATKKAKKAKKAKKTSRK
jgi:hypothetical protein